MNTIENLCKKTLVVVKPFAEIRYYSDAVVEILCSCDKEIYVLIGKIIGAVPRNIRNMLYRLIARYRLKISYFFRLNKNTCILSPLNIKLIN